MGASSSGTLRTNLHSLLCKIPGTLQSLNCNYCEDFMYWVSQELEPRFDRVPGMKHRME
jgi:hypothetical protein